MAVAPVPCRVASTIPRPQKFLPASNVPRGHRSLSRANNSKRSGPGAQVRPTPGSRKARGLEGGRAAKREAQGARPRGRGRDGRERGRARAPSHGRGGGRGRSRWGGGGAKRRRREEGTLESSRVQGGRRRRGGGARQGGDALAGWEGGGAALARACPVPAPVSHSSFHLRPAGAAERLRSPVPGAAACFSPHPRPRRARQSPHDALLHLGHGWVSAGWPLGGCAGLVSFSASCPAEAGEQGAAPASGGAARGRVRRQGPEGRGGPSAAVFASCARRPRHVRPSQPRGALGKRRRAGAGVPGQPPHTSSQKMVRGAGGGGG